MFLAEWRAVQPAHPGLHRLGLDPEVELFGQVVGEVGDDVLGGQSAAQFGVFDHLREAFQDLQVRGHPPADARPLDFDDDVLAGVQRRIVDLGDGCRSEWPFLEMLEQLRGLGTEFFGEQLVHFAGVGGGHRVQQAAELTRQRLAECTRAGGDDLAELRRRWGRGRRMPVESP